MRLQSPPLPRHRLAPLSEGRIHESGQLQCTYHGWLFDGSGSCTSIPQIPDPKAHATACSSNRACVSAYPTQVGWVELRIYMLQSLLHAQPSAVNLLELSWYSVSDCCCCFCSQSQFSESSDRCYMPSQECVFLAAHFECTLLGEGEHGCLQGDTVKAMTTGFLLDRQWLLSCLVGHRLLVYGE